MKEATLKHYQSRLQAVRAMQLEIELSYDTRFSPQMDHISSGTSSPDRSGPTVRALEAINRKRERLAAMIDDLSRTEDEIEDWLATIPDHRLCAIIRCRFLVGKPWKEISGILGLIDEDSAYKIYNRKKKVLAIYEEE